MAQRGDGLNDVFEHSVTIRENVYVQGGTIQDTPTADKNIANKKYVDDQIAGISPSSAPTGSVIMYAGDKTGGIPTGWLLCDGSSVSETTYSALFAVIGHSFGGDPGGGNFRLPDLRQRFPWGSNGGDDPGLTGGSSTYKPEGSIDAHSGGSIREGAVINPTVWFNNPVSHTFNGTTDSNHLPPYLVLNFIIKT